MQQFLLINDSLVLYGTGTSCSFPQIFKRFPQPCEKARVPTQVDF